MANQSTLEFEKQVVGKVSRRVLPLVIVCMFISFLDRINIGFAALQMNAELNLSAAAYGFGAGLFFIGYFAFEVPSNLILQKVGPRIWIARIMVTWGLVACCFALIKGETTFYILRFLLGLAEAGFVPGVIFMLTFWFRAKERAFAMGAFIGGSYVAGIVGSPLSGLIMTYMNEVLGIAGWRWLFIIEGFPAIVLAFFVLKYLSDKPDKAKWLTSEEKTWLNNAIAEEQKAVGEEKHISVWKALIRPRTLLLSLAYVCYVGGNIGLQLWMPQIIKTMGSGLSMMSVTALTALPYIAILLAMLLWSRHSDKTKERMWHVTIAAVVAAIGLVISAGASSLTVGLFGLIITGLGLGGTQPTFWASATQILDPRESAVAIAVINSVGNLGGFFGPNLMGYFKSLTGRYNTGIYIFAASFILMIVLMYIVYQTNKKRFQDSGNA